MGTWTIQFRNSLCHRILQVLLLALFHLDNKKYLTILLIKLNGVLDQIEQYQLKVIPVSLQIAPSHFFKGHENTEAFTHDIFLKVQKLLEDELTKVFNKWLSLPKLILVDLNSFYLSLVQKPELISWLLVVFWHSDDIPSELRVYLEN